MSRALERLTGLISNYSNSLPPGDQPETFVIRLMEMRRPTEQSNNAGKSDDEPFWQFISIPGSGQSGSPASGEVNNDGNK